MTARAWQLAPTPVPVGSWRLDADQEAVVRWSSGPLLVLAGPGTGKTHCVAEAALARCREGAPAGSVLVLAGGRQAAAELRDRLARALAGAEPPQVATFHGFALALAMRAQPPEAPLRLLSGAEQERAVREVIDGTLSDPALRGRWPHDLRDAVPTRGFAREARAAFAAARALGLTGAEVAALGARASAPAWAAIGPVLDEYLESQEQQGALDYAEVMFRALAVAADSQHRPLLGHLRHVLVDDLQDADAMQLALLTELGRHARTLVAFADPDQAVHAFRGADERTVRRFPDAMAAMAAACGQEQTTVLRLRTSHRLPAAVHAYAVGAFDGRAPLGLTGVAAAEHRSLRCAEQPGVVRVEVYDDAMAEAAFVVARIRELAQAGADWSEIAVLGRSAAHLGPVERALQRAGIPCRIDVADGALAEAPPVAALLLALEAVAGPEVHLAPHAAHDFLLSPLVGLDPVELRALGRALRSATGAASDRALAAALMAAQPSTLLLDVPGVDRLEAARSLLHRVHARVRAGASPHEALWLLWSGTSWPERLRQQALAQGSPLAHRDLDAVCDLFDIADRSVQRRQGRAGVSAFLYELRAQEIPARTLTRRGFRGPAVELLTAHRSQGRAWPHVLVVGVNDGAWPNLRRRSSLLDVDRLTPDGLIPARDRNAILEEERRLFYVACTRASRTLHVSGVVGDDGDPESSRLLANRVLRPRLRPGRPTSVDSVASLVAELRRVATGPSTEAALRQAAVQRLRHLAAAVDGRGEPLFPEAQPERWWGARPRTDSAVPVSPRDEALYVRASSLQLLQDCRLAWFLQQRVHAESVRGSALVFGTALHALIDGVTSGALAPSAEVVLQRLEQAWSDAAYDAAWQSRRDLEEAAHAIARFLAWHALRAPQRVRSEAAFDRVVAIPTADGEWERLRMRGTVDRLEVLDDGSAVVIDFKTSRSPASAAAAAAHPQLRYYQHAVAEGLLDEPGSPASLRPAGAQLVYLRLDAPRSSEGLPRTLTQPPPTADDPWVTDVLAPALQAVRREETLATAGSHCTNCSVRAACPLQPEGRIETA